MTDPFSPDQIAALSAEIDRQLRDLGPPADAFARGGIPAPGLPEAQRRAIEQATGEPADSFLQRFRQAARRDLCEPGGILYEQWIKWKDVSNGDLVKTFGAVLVGMGLSGSAVQIAVVAIAVYVLYLGVQAFCREAPPCPSN